MFMILKERTFITFDIRTTTETHHRWQENKITSHNFWNLSVLITSPFSFHHRKRVNPIIYCKFHYYTFSFLAMNTSCLREITENQINEPYNKVAGKGCELLHQDCDQYLGESVWGLYQEGRQQNFSFTG